jgi:uncharacterized lipoprotein YddW (UPF0748 family)
MKSKIVPTVLAFSAVVMLAGCSFFKPTTDKVYRIPSADREFRGVWVATVANIDWPSKPGLSVDEQKKEALAILDTCVALHLNAIVFQVRPHCDAMYDSKLEPWSSYLTGQQGNAPNPYYDPLTFWVEESHKRGLELHAWFNPYRAFMPRGGDISEKSIVKIRPGLAKKLDNGTYWLDPAKKEVQDHSFNVIMDVLKRYDVDGIHFDDYFYPYPSGSGSFPDDDSWAEYTKSGGSLNRDDWRRAAVNTFIERVYDGVKKEKPYVKFGISPFGIGKPGDPPSIQGFDQYSGLYADAWLWFREGWIDYWTPQLYWPVNQIPQSFPVLLGWWTRENVKGRNLWPGMIIGRMTSEKGADEIVNQIMIARGFIPEGPGHVHFSMKAFMRDSTFLNSALITGPYKNMALVPPTPWLDDKAPAAPSVKATVTNDTLLTISWSHQNPADVFRWVIYYQYGRTWDYTILNAQDREIVIPMNRIIRDRPRLQQGDTNYQTRIDALMNIAVSAVDRVGNESELTHRALKTQTAQSAR